MEQSKSQYNLLTGGINTDVTPLKQPENTTRETLNFVLIDNGGDLFSITNEEGTVLYNNVSFPEGFKPIGYTILDKDIILVLANNEGHSQIGYIRQDFSNLDSNYGFYHPSAPYDKENNLFPTNNSEFGFQISYPVSLVARKLINGHRIVYFTDNHVPYGRVDLDNPPLVGTIRDEVKLNFNMKIPEISIKAIKENVSGSFKPGVVQIITRYVTKSGGVTNFGMPSNPIPLVPSLRSDGVNNYRGAFNEDGNVNKNILVEFKDVDTTFTELEIVLIYYEGTQSVFKASVVAQIPITSDTIEYLITGIDYENVIDLTIDELNKTSVSYTRAKCISQKDNTLFLSNLSSDRELNFNEIQLAANNSIVSYRVNEVQYNGRGETFNSGELSYFSDLSPFLSSSKSIRIPFNKEINAGSGSLTNFTLLKSGTASSGLITFVNNTILDGDTITIGVGPSQASVVFTAEVTNSNTMNKFLIGATKEETAINLFNSILYSTDVTEFSPILESDKIYLFWNTVLVGSDGVTIASSTINITTSNFSGYNSDNVEINPTVVIIEGKNIDLEFNIIVTTNETLRISNVTSINGDVYSTGDNNSLTILLEEEGSNSIVTEKGFTDYINEQFTFSFKTYRRGEVYSFGFVLVYKDGTTSPVFHIPGNKNYVNDADYDNGKFEFEPTGIDAWGNYNTGETYGKLGTYVSQDSYPLNQNYPGNQIGDDLSNATLGNTARKIRHHLIPRLENEPHFRDSNNFGIQLIRLINIEISLNLSETILQDVQKIVFVRERRNNDTNRSIYAQGLINKHGILADDYTNGGEVQGTSLIGGTIFPNVKSGYFTSEMPFANNYKNFIHIAGFIIGNNGPWQSTGKITNGIAAPVSPDLTGQDYEDGKKLFTELLKDRCSFYSPETVLFTGFRFDPEQILNANLVPAMLLKGNSNLLNVRKENWISDNTEVFLKYYQTGDLFANYNSYFNAVLPNAIKIELARYVDAGKHRLSPLDSDENGLITSTRWSTSYLEMKGNNNFHEENGLKLEIKNEIDAKVFQYCILNCNKDTKTGDIIQDTSDGEFLKRFLYNIKTNNLRQYGQISSGSFIAIATRKPFDLSNNVVTNFNGIYGGDTFITKFSFNNTTMFPYFPFKRYKDAAINRPSRTTSQRINGYGHIDNIEIGGTTGGGPGHPAGKDYRTCNYYFVESNINTFYRHKPIDETKQDYYPNEENPGNLLENFLGYLDNIRSYNAQYSYENNVKEFFTRGSTQEVISSYENRVIYSETAANDDTLDSYRSFLQSNYYDLPSETGPIWNSFVFNNDLYLHTTKSLWKTFAENSATLSSDTIDEVVLGTGKLFSRPSYQVTTMLGGYGGTISQYAGCSTRIGYFFPDVLQEKVFALMIGDRGSVYLKEVSEEGLQSFFKEYISEGIIKFNGVINEGALDFPNLIDNPYNGIGLNSCYDQNLKRWILTKRELNGVKNFTKSFSTLNQKWFSHSYFPDIMISYNNQIFFFKNSELWEMNKGDRGSYFGETYDSVIEICCNFQMIKKVFKSIVVDSESNDLINGLKIRDNSFNKLQVYNDRQNSFELTLKQGNTFNPTELPGELLIKFRNDEYRISVPRDSVIDNNQNIFEENNKDFTKLFKEKIKGDFALFKFKYDNSNKYKFTVHLISINFGINER